MSFLEWDYGDDIDIELDARGSVIAAFQEVVAYQARQIRQCSLNLDVKDQAMDIQAKKSKQEISASYQRIQQLQGQLNDALAEIKRLEGRESDSAKDKTIETLQKAVKDHAKLTQIAEEETAKGREFQAKQSERIDELKAEIKKLEGQISVNNAAWGNKVSELNARNRELLLNQQKAAVHLQKAIALWEEENGKSFQALRHAINVLPKVS